MSTQADTLTVYTYAKCSTCRDAVRWLQSREVEFVERAIRETPPSVKELRAMLGFLGGAEAGALRKLFNSSGIEYRALGMAEKLPMLTEGEALELLSKNGSLVKRPFVIGANVGTVGFNEKRWGELLVGE